MTRISKARARELGLIPRLEPISKRIDKTPDLKESDIQRQIKEYLQWNGWFVVKIHQSLGSYKGIADLYAIRAGRSVWIEVKTPYGHQSSVQKDFERDIKSHGGEYIVARSVEDVEILVKAG